ncbi:MAG: hypothetical protein HGA87_01355 [Desulfobulbaceae bacterium]|nr:hypothetical protein [Desulfobulbaceae bacterium]
MTYEAFDKVHWGKNTIVTRYAVPGLSVVESVDFDNRTVMLDDGDIVSPELIYQVIQNNGKIVE